MISVLSTVSWLCRSTPFPPDVCWCSIALYLPLGLFLVLLCLEYSRIMSIIENCNRCTLYDLDTCLWQSHAAGGATVHIYPQPIYHTFSHICLNNYDIRMFMTVQVLKSIKMFVPQKYEYYTNRDVIWWRHWRHNVNICNAFHNIIYIMIYASWDYLHDTTTFIIIWLCCCW